MRRVWGEYEESMGRVWGEYEEMGKVWERHRKGMGKVCGKYGISNFPKVATSRNDLKRIFLVDGELGLIGVWRRIVNLGDMGGWI